jgi:Polysulphide reductase, NrfD
MSEGAGGHRDASMSRGAAARALQRAREALGGERDRHEGARAGERDMTPALGTAGEPGRWRRAAAGARVALARDNWGDARWSFLYGPDTDYATTEAPDVEKIQQAARDARTGEPPPVVQGPMIKPPVWTWEIPLYFWFGGMAAGASFVAVACDLVGDQQTARVARKVALGALIPCPPLLIMDLGRPERFYNMLRIFKPRSPMSTGAWALTAFGNLAAAAVGADLLGKRRLAQVTGGANAIVGGYLGSYTGVLLATTAVPLWARSRLYLGPIFVATGTATGAAVVRLAVSAAGRKPSDPTREALGRVEAGAMAAELVLSWVNERRLGRLAHALEEGRPGRLYKTAKTLAAAGIAARLAHRRLPAGVQHVSSVGYMAAALCFRYAWVEAGKASARDDEAVARMARGRATRAEPEATLQVIHHK